MIVESQVFVLFFSQEEIKKVSQSVVLIQSDQLYFRQS